MIFSFYEEEKPFPERPFVYLFDVCDVTKCVHDGFHGDGRRVFGALTLRAEFRCKGGVTLDGRAPYNAVILIILYLVLSSVLLHSLLDEHLLLSSNS